MSLPSELALKTVPEITKLSTEICDLAGNYDIEISPEARRVLFIVAHEAAVEILRRACPMASEAQIQEVVNRRPGNRQAN